MPPSSKEEEKPKDTGDVAAANNEAAGLAEDQRAVPAILIRPSGGTLRDMRADSLRRQINDDYMAQAASTLQVAQVHFSNRSQADALCSRCNDDCDYDFLGG